MTFLELVVTGILALSIYSILFAFVINWIANVGYDISPFLIVGFFGILMIVIIVSLKVLLSVS